MGFCSIKDLDLGSSKCSQIARSEHHSTRKKGLSQGLEAAVWIENGCANETVCLLSVNKALRVSIKFWKYGQLCSFWCVIKQKLSCQSHETEVLQNCSFWHVSVLDSIVDSLFKFFRFHLSYQDLLVSYIFFSAENFTFMHPKVSRHKKISTGREYHWHCYVALQLV